MDFMLQNYENVLYNLRDFHSDIEDVFVHRANDNGRISNKEMDILLADLRDVLPIDVEEAKDFFSETNEPVEKYFELSAMTCQDFIDILKMWLQQKVASFASAGNMKALDKVDVEQKEIENKVYEEVMKKESALGSYVENNRQETEEYQEVDHGYNNDYNNVQEIKVNQGGMNTTKNFRANREKLDELLVKYREAFHEKFELFYDEATGKMPLIEVFIFLRECFYVTPMLVFEKEGDDRDFFEAYENEVKLRDLVRAYFVQIKGFLGRSSDLDNIYLDFEECFDVLDYWFQTDGDVFLTENGVLKQKEIDSQNQIEDLPLQSLQPLQPLQQVQSVQSMQPAVKPFKASNNYDDGIDYMEIIRQKELEKAKSQSAIKEIKFTNNQGDGIDYIEIIRNREMDLKKKAEKVEKAEKPEKASIFLQKANLEPLKEEIFVNKEKKAEKENLVMQKPRKNSDRRLKALKEIFDYYAKHSQVNTGKAPTFDKIEKKMHSLNLGKLSIVLKSFRIKVDTFNLKKTFKKVASNSEDLDFNEFCTILQVISKDAELIKEAKVHKYNPNVMKGYKPDSYKQTPTSEMNQKYTGVVESKKGSEAGKFRSEEERMEDMWEHMGLYDGSYRGLLQNTTGTLNNNNPDNVEGFRYQLDNDKQKNKLGSKTKLDELRDDSADARGNFRRLDKETKLQSLSIPKMGGDRLAKIEPTPRRDMKSESGKKEQVQSTIKIKKSKTAGLHEKKISMHEIGKFNHGDIKSLADKKFDPSNLIQEDDEEDRLYLKEYNIDYGQPRGRTTTKKIDEIPSNIDMSNMKKRMPGKYTLVSQYNDNIRKTSQSPVNEPFSFGDRQMELAPLNYGPPKAHTALPQVSNYNDYNFNPFAGNYSVKNNMINPINVQQRNQFPENYNYFDPMSVKNDRISYMQNGPDMFNPYPNNNQYMNRGGMGQDRINQLQQGYLKRENEMMYNAMNIHNNRIEQGMKAVRKY